MRLADTADLRATRAEAMRLAIEDKPLLANCLHACADTAEIVPELLSALKQLLTEVDDMTARAGWAGNGGRDMARTVLGRVDAT